MSDIELEKEEDRIPCPKCKKGVLKLYKDWTGGDPKKQHMELHCKICTFREVHETPMQNYTNDIIRRYFGYDHE